MIVLVFVTLTYFYVMMRFADGSGSINANEFQNVMQSIGETLSVDEISDLVRELDEDGDGEIDFEEFGNMLRRHAVVT